MLQLSSPLVIFDVETTGTDAELDRIIDLAAIKIFPDGARKEFFRRYNPGIPISKEVSAIHGITDADVMDSYQFGSYEAEEVIKLFVGADVAGFNVSFDIRFLRKTLDRIGFGEFAKSWDPRILDAHQIFTKFERRTLTAAVKFYLDEDHTKAHSAIADVEATERVLLRQVAHYELPANADELFILLAKPDDGFVDRDKRFKWVNGEAYVAFGKHNNKPLRSIDKNYLTWITKGEFSLEVRRIAENALNQIFPVKEPPRV